MLRGFAGDRHGNVAIIFGLAALPLMLAIGAAIDYSRAADARTSMQKAVDAAALNYGKGVLGTRAGANLTSTRRVFDVNFGKPEGAVLTAFNVERTTEKVTVLASADVPASFMRLVGTRAIPISARAEVPLGAMRLEIALVLDNTGSMASAGKMEALKASAKSLIDILETSTAFSTNVEVAVVPFATQVRIDTGNRYANWMKYSPGDPDPVLEITQDGWQGCVADRDQPHDASVTAPTGAPATKYPGANCLNPALARIMPLTRDFNALRNAIDGMNPTGTTNTVIGLSWGVSTLTRGAPLSAGAQAPQQYLRKFIVFLTDGVNTRSRHAGLPAPIDARMNLLCAQAKTTSINIFTIRVIDGNEALLRGCATRPDMYYSVNESGELRKVFENIARELMRVRLST